jgi:diadenosine tetraphosphate (Ap4A) HIT family hydrolase
LNDAGGTSDCLFCNVLRQPSDMLPWHDRLLARVPDVGAVIAGLGAFVPGYVLVFPEQHVESSLRMSTTAHQAFADLIWTTAGQVEMIFGSPTVFEHGTCPNGLLRRSACLDHAHIHIIPGCYNLERRVRSSAESSSQAAARITRRRDSGYLFLQEPDADPLYSDDPGVSQFFRRHIAGELGEPDDWDYLLFPRLNNVRETITKFPAGE